MFGFAMIWVGILVGSRLTSVEAVQGFMFTVIFPLTFLANTFAPDREHAARGAVPRRVEPRLRAHPGARELWGNDGRVPAPADAAFPLHHAVPMTIFWSVVITALVAPAAVAAFRRRSQD